MLKPKSLSLLAGAIAIAAVTSSPAMADLVLVGPLNLTGSGFGALPRALTLQSHGGSSTSESGCVGPGPTVGGGACTVGPSVGGDEAPPPKFPKQAAPTLSSLGITDANQIAIVFDAVQAQNPPNQTVMIQDLTLKLYNAAGTTLLTTAVLSPEPLSLVTNPGNGTTDYLFELNAAEAATFDTKIAGNFADIISLNSTISFPSGSAGPESYALVDVATVPAPLIGHGLLVLLAVGGVLFGGKLLERSKNRRSLETANPHAAA
jgi:hypothetical protein